MNIIKQLILSGYHNRTIALDKLSQRTKITPKKARRAFRSGEAARLAGIHCHCPDCETTFKP